MTTSLQETLLLYLEPFAQADVAGGSVEQLVPLQLTARRGAEGLVLGASPPQSIYRQGFEVPVHRVRITGIWEEAKDDLA